MDLANQVLGSNTHLGPMKNLGPGLYSWEDTSEFIAWMELNPEEISNHTHIYAITATEDTSRGYTGFVLIADDLLLELIYFFEIDGTQLIGLEDLLLEEDILPSLHFKDTSTRIQVGHDFASYPSLPNNWFKRPTNPTRGSNADWQEFDVNLPSEKPKPRGGHSIVKLKTMCNGSLLPLYYMRVSLMRYGWGHTLFGRHSQIILCN